ncbi:B12-binding domain-containing radical SAM protein [Candidatus Latescibacterota bacterium]
MRNKSVIFIEPTGNKTNVFDNFMRLPLMGSLYLGTILYNHGYDVKILNENILGKEIDPFEIQADIFCITALSVSANRAKLLAGQLKKIYPESRVLIGGIHASLMPEDFSEVADHVIIGEADEIIIDIVENKYQEKVIQGSRIEDMDTLPVINYKLLEGYENLKTVPIMTSRGCPFNCNFCSVTKIFGRKFRKQSPQRIITEIENVLTYFKNKGFFFYDDNLTADRKRIDKLCDMLIEKNLEISWFAQVRADLSKDPDLISKMVKAGLRWVYIGFESINDETLKTLNKSQTKSDIEKAIRVFHQCGVNIHGMFMFGEDHDTVEDISRTVEFAKENEIDTVQFMILTPLPGTEYYKKIEQEKRLIHKNWDYYNGMFVVFLPKNMSPATLTNETSNAYEKFYSLKRNFLDTLYLTFNIFFDAFVWNFRRVNRYGLDIMFKRGAAKVIVTKYSDICKTYLRYLKNLEKEGMYRL